MNPSILRLQQRKVAAELVDACRVPLSFAAQAVTAENPAGGFEGSYLQAYVHRELPGQAGVHPVFAVDPGSCHSLGDR